ncbi:Pc17g00120 [Penicillium rubens Wisconsin 54-1255]|uniref:Pc17g00120 protein n=1 Tax=Penicillium rubens (strain ATCC 28089 / DSM 1075 / NRRL 1951 / Wisconsin 54-1255) TaxID=500485 RepID=B6HAU8_PENRW|nr:Pc17g00120 [Penicillium rubens Wisconsin 54-1255]
MSEQSSSGPHRSKLANKLDPRVDSGLINFPGSHNVPDAHLGYAHNYGKGGRHDNKIANMLDPRVYSDQDNSHRGNVAASTTFVPQAGKLAGIYNPEADEPYQRVESNSSNRRCENVAGSSHFIPQTGKPTSNP